MIRNSSVFRHLMIDSNEDPFIPVGANMSSMDPAVAEGYWRGSNSTTLTAAYAANLRAQGFTAMRVMSSSGGGWDLSQDNELFRVCKLLSDAGVVPFVADHGKKPGLDIGDEYDFRLQMFIRLAQRFEAAGITEYGINPWNEPYGNANPSNGPISVYSPRKPGAQYGTPGTALHSRAWVDTYVRFANEFLPHAPSAYLLIDDIHYGQGRGLDGASHYLEQSAVLVYGEEVIAVAPDRIGFAMHCYSRWAGKPNDIRAYLDQAEAKGLPIVIGEFGGAPQGTEPTNASKNDWPASVALNEVIFEYTDVGAWAWHSHQSNSFVLADVDNPEVQALDPEPGSAGRVPVWVLQSRDHYKYSGQFLWDIAHRQDVPPIDPPPPEDPPVISDEWYEPQETDGHLHFGFTTDQKCNAQFIFSNEDDPTDMYLHRGPQYPYVNPVGNERPGWFDHEVRFPEWTGGTTLTPGATYTVDVEVVNVEGLTTTEIFEIEVPDDEGPTPDPAPVISNMVGTSLPGGEMEFTFETDIPSVPQFLFVNQADSTDRFEHSGIVAGTSHRYGRPGSGNDTELMTPGATYNVVVTATSTRGVTSSASTTFYQEIDTPIDPPPPAFDITDVVLVTDAVTIGHGLVTFKTTIDATGTVIFSNVADGSDILVATLNTWSQDHTVNIPDDLGTPLQEAWYEMIISMEDDDGYQAIHKASFGVGDADPPPEGSIPVEWMASVDEALDVLVDSVTELNDRLDIQRDDITDLDNRVKALESLRAQIKAIL